MSAQYRVAVIGTGHMHALDVMAAFDKHPDFTICGAADVPPTAPEPAAAAPTRAWVLQELQKRYGIPLLHDNWLQLLDIEKPDLCIVCSENVLHREIAEACAARGIDVCLEKPMAVSLAAGIAIDRAVRAAGTLLMVNWPLTWRAGFHTAKRLVDEGAIGRIYEVKTRMGHAGPLGRDALNLYLGTSSALTDAERGQTWWHNRASGGGVMLDYCCYGCLLSCWFTGKHPTGAMGMRLNTATPAGDAEDNAALLLRFDDCYAVLQGSWTTYGHTFHSPILYGEKGNIVCDYKTGQVQICGADGILRDVAADPLPPELTSIAAAYAHHKKTGAPLHQTLTAAFNLEVMAALDAGLRSADSGKFELVQNPHWQIG